jgi:hypothetical protein
MGREKPEGSICCVNPADGTIAVLSRLDDGGWEVMAASEGMAMETVVKNEEFVDLLMTGLNGVFAGSDGTCQASMLPTFGM